MAFFAALLSICLLQIQLSTNIGSYEHSERRLQLTVKASNRETQRTLVVLIGSLRAGEAAWQSLYSNLLEPTNADLAMITEDQIPPAYQNASLFTRAKYQWLVPKYQDWADALDLVHNSNQWRNELLSLYAKDKNTMLGGIANTSASGAIVFMFRWFLRQKLKEHHLTDYYDRFVVTRTDQQYICPKDLRQLDNRYLWVPQGETYDGVTDRFFIANRTVILSALDTLGPLLAEPNRYAQELGMERYNSERFQLRRWLEDGLEPQFFYRNMITVASELDTTRWSTPLNMTTSEGLHLKYYKEYMSALWGCGHRWEFSKALWRRIVNNKSTYAQHK